jgi:signal transduction histidine kinase
MTIKPKVLLTQDAFSGVLVAVIILAIGFTYGLGHVYLVPDPGFSYDGRWQITDFSNNCPADTAVDTTESCNTGRDTLEIGDVILAIEDPITGERLTNEDYNTILTVTPFDGFLSGDRVLLDIKRGETAMRIEWVMPEHSSFDQIQSLSTILVFLPFWLAGTAVLLFLRPKDSRWRLLILQNYITGLWIAIGTVAYSQIFGSVYLSIGLSWLIMPIYLHLHLLIPSPLPLKGRWWIPALYLSAGLMALLNMLAVFPLPTYYLALVIGIGGSLLLLLLRTLRSGLPAERSALNLMLLGIGVSLLPGILLFLVPDIFVHGYTASPTVTLLAILSIPTLSFFYTYALYKHRLGNQEVRANRALTSYSFVIIYATLFIFAFVLIGQWIKLDTNVSILIATIYMLAGFAVRPPFERFMNRVVYGTSYEPEHIVQQFANAIPRALNPTYLSDLLINQVMPSLLIRQSALYWLVDEQAQRVYAEQTPGIPPLLAKEDSDRFQPYFSSFLPNAEQLEERSLPGPLPVSFDWVRLVIPIELDGRSVGIWLFGRRDPDDFYPQRDIELLMTLGSQVGIALESARLFGIEQRRADELERANFELHRAIRVKNDMLRNISHELRTPLTAISGYTDLLMDGVAGDLSAEQTELLSIVADRAQALRTMINDLIAYQQARAQEMEMIVVNIPNIAQESMQTARTLAANPNYAGRNPHKFAFDCADNQLSARANPSQFNQIFSNLLSNAVKFSPEGGTIAIAVRAGVYQFEHENPDEAPALFAGDSGPMPKVAVELPAIFVSVRDGGIGIAPEELDNIWLDFYQIDGSATRRFGGTGLGLALVRDIVQAHGGVIWATSRFGVETTVTFVIPRVDPE